MFKNYLKVAIRNLLRYKIYSFINVVGLAIGMACCLLILLYVLNELSYDQYHEKKDRIYRLAISVKGTAYDAIAKIPGPWGPAAVQELPEVEQMARFVFFGQSLVSRGVKRFYEAGGIYADPSVFDVFSFSLIRGNPKTALAKPNSVVISEETAKKYFGDEDPLGQTLIFDSESEMVVTGIVANVPANSHFSFSFLVPLETYEHPLRDDWTKWYQFYTYLLLAEGASPSAVETKFPSLLNKHVEAKVAANYTPFLQPLTDIHLHSNLFREMATNSDITYVYIFSTIAFFILLIACINFMNLETARSARRAKEVGLRKVVGAYRRHLVCQFLGEAILMSLLALLVALVMVELCLPIFSELVGKGVVAYNLNSFSFWLGLVGISLFVGIVSGSYPAFALSSFTPAQVLKGNSNVSGNASLRKTLVVFQFAISAFLIIAAGIVNDQLDYIHNKKLGFNKEQLVIIPIRDEAMKQKYEVVKNELLKHPDIIKISASANMPGGSDYGIPTKPEGIPDDQIPPMRILVVDTDFIETYQMEIVEGRKLSKEIGTDANSGFVINEEAAKQLGWENPIGKTIAMPALGRESAPIIGIVKDFHFRSMYEKIGPIIIFIQPPNWFSRFSVRIRSQNIARTLAFLEEKWAEFDPIYPFTYTFFDDQFDQLHRAEERIGRIVGYFTEFAILIACLGLFGLVSFTTQQRTKEIGVRKVLGASVMDIIILLSREFTGLVVIALVVATPLAYFAMRQWLTDFAYRTNMEVETFLLAGGLALIIAWLTVSYQSIKAALANPVDALRYE